MKEQQDNLWKEGILKDFEKPTHQGFTEDVMLSIEQHQESKSLVHEPLISPRQWFITTLALATVIVSAVLVEYKMELKLGYLERYSQQLLQFLNEQTSLLWIAFSLVGVFFALVVLGKGLNFKR